MNSQEDSQRKNVNLIVIISIAVLSFVAMILVFTTDFGWFWYGSGYSTYYFWIGSQTAPIWAQIFLVLLALIFLVSFGYSIVLLLIILSKITIKVNQKMQAFIGLFLAIAAFVYNGLMVGLFAIAAIEAWWGLSTSFYSSLVGSIMIGVLYTIYLVNINKEKVETPAK